MVYRQITENILKNLSPGFINIIYGARRVGKTVLLDQIKQKLEGERTVFFNGDTQETRDLLSTSSEGKLSQAIENYPVIFIDEAQRITNISLALKIIIDKYPDKKIFVTGSSSLELAKGARETLTGRTKIYKLYPLSFAEMTTGLDNYKKDALLENALVYGGYPYLLNLGSLDEKQSYLKTILEDYLLRDVLLLENITNPDTLIKLATLLAFQVGQEVSLRELSVSLGIGVATVARYISLLEQSFVIFTVSAFSRNLRKEISKTKKYYFYDLGIRNALIRQFSPIAVRSDLGQIWENFLILERTKKYHYSSVMFDGYFWRNYDQAEIDWIEKKKEDIKAFEFKWQKKKYSTPKGFSQAYGVKAELISRENYLGFIL